MTSSVLLLWIVGGLVLQLAIYLGIGFGRHWQSYQALRTTVMDEGLPVKPRPLPAEEDTVPAAWSGWRTFRVTHKILENADQDICSFHLAPQDGQALPPFLPGQFLTFRLTIPSPPGNIESVTRCYSLSDAPHPGHYRVSIKRVPASTPEPTPPGRSSNFFHDQVQVGSLLQVRAPAGHFYLDRSDAPVVLIGGGIGITPMLSMLNWCLSAQTGREIWLFYGVRHHRELVAQPHLEALAQLHPNFHLRICLSGNNVDDGVDPRYRHHGRVDVDLLRRVLPLRPYHFYICGPTPMLESLVPALEDWGVAPAHIHFEAFGPASIRRRHAEPAPTSPAPASGTTVSVNFSKTGKQLPWQAGCGTLLELAEAHGISVATGCRSGSCGSCQTVIQSGEVFYPQAPDFDPEPGTCLMCVGTPQTSVTLEL